MTIEVDLSEIINAIKSEIPDMVQRAAITTLDDAGRDIEQIAKTDAPVRTGNMRDNVLTVERTEDSVTVEAKAPYSGYVEEGTSKMAAKPFLFPAGRAVAEKVPSDFVNNLG